MVFEPRRIVLLACATAMLCTLAGCRSSDALKEIIYDQSSQTVDYDNPNKFKINDSEATEVDNNLPSNEVVENAPVTEERQNLVVFSSKPNSPQFTAKQSLWDPKPEFSGIEASSPVAFYEDANSSIVQDLGKKEPEPEDEKKDESEDDEGKNSVLGQDGSGDDSNKGDQEGNSKKKDEKDVNGDGGNDGGDDDVANNNGDGGFVDSDLTGDYVDTPKVKSGVAAYGDAAIMVQMLGGEGALVAADKELLDSQFSSVFADEGAANIVAAWKGDGEESSQINVDKIIDSGASAVLVYSTSYLSSKDKKKLEKAGVAVLKIYRFSNSSYIKKNATTIGDLLEELSKGKSVSMADEYVQFCDGLIKDVSGGTLAGSELYEKGMSASKANKKYKFDTTACTTLLLNDWDSTASYSGSIDGWTPSGKGVATATIGYVDSPVSFYIQAGGLVNNAAAKGSAISSKTGSVIAWQFNGNVATFSKKKWNYSSGGAVDKCLDVKGDGWNTSLFTSESAKANSEYTVSKTFGSESFPKLIAATQAVKEGIVENSKKNNSIYHPYGLTDKTEGGISVSAFGKLSSGGSLVFSSIGADYDTMVNAFDEEGAIPEDSVEVNPYGLFSSWIDGSCESVLEAAWVAGEVNDNTSCDYKTYVKDFYSTFYRYDLTSKELTNIESGLKK